MTVLFLDSEGMSNPCLDSGYGVTCQAISLCWGLRVEVHVVLNGCGAASSWVGLFCDCQVVLPLGYYDLAVAGAGGLAVLAWVVCREK